MTRRSSLPLLALAALLAGCDSGSSNTCSLQGGTQLAASTWPKFRADVGNTGRAAVDLTDSVSGTGQLLFEGVCSVETLQTCDLATGCPPLSGTCMPIGPIASTPILDEQTPSPNIYLASADSNIYAVDSLGAMLDIEQQMELSSAAIGSPLIGVNNPSMVRRQILFATSNSFVGQFDITPPTEPGEQITGAQIGISTPPGNITASVNIWSGNLADDMVDGTVFVPTLNSVLTGICPNDVPRWSVNFPGTQSSVALVQNPTLENEVTPIIMAGGGSGTVRAYNLRGRQIWSFFAAATITAAVLIDPSTTIGYIADTSGRVVAIDVTNGQPTGAAPFRAVAGISASPALSRDTVSDPRIYVADQDGVLYALDRATLEERWRFVARGPDGENMRISSSPAVATGGERDIIVFGADLLGIADPTAAEVPIGGFVYAIRDDGDHATEQWRFDLGYSIGAASPSIGIDQVVYIGRQGTRLGTPDECPEIDRDSNGVRDACVVNDGGGLYRITP